MITGLKNFSFIVIGRTGSAGLQAIFYLTFAVILKPEDYGNLGYIIALAGAFSIVSRFGLNHTVVYSQAKKDHELSDQINFFVLVTTGLASLILVIINPIAGILCMATSMFAMSIGNLLGLKQYRNFMSINLLKGSFIIAIPLFFYYNFGLDGILWGMIIGYFICSYNYFSFLKYKKEAFTKIKNNIKLFINNFGFDLSSNFVRFIDRIIIGFLLGYSFLGIYQLNIQILFGFEMLPIALHSFLLSEETSGHKHKKFEIIVVVLSVIISILVIMLSPYAISSFFPAYQEGIPSLQILILTLIPLSLSYILNAKIQSKGSNKLGYSAIVRLGTLIILLPLLGNIIGLIGVALAVLFSSSFYTIFLYFLYKKSK